MMLGGETVPLLQRSRRAGSSLPARLFVSAIALCVIAASVVWVAPRTTALERKLATGMAGRAQGQLARAQQLADVEVDQDDLGADSLRFK